MKTFDWRDLRRLGSTDNALRFTATDPVVCEYIALGGYRSPSRAWPHSHSKPLLTAKFAKWAIAKHPQWAASKGLIEEVAA